MGRGWGKGRVSRAGHGFLGTSLCLDIWLGHGLYLKRDDARVGVGRGTGQAGPSTASWLGPRGRGRHAGFCQPSWQLREHQALGAFPGGPFWLRCASVGACRSLPDLAPSPTHQESGAARDRVGAGGEEVSRSCRQWRGAGGDWRTSKLLWAL